ncbi:MAG: DUF2470 domain-containing protein [Myxococcales bacterium]|nr:DUF2470 domain-containing protein [Myxococcales bacterium]
MKTTDDEALGDEVRGLLRGAHVATLCTLAAKPALRGFPFGSVVPYALDGEGRPLVYLARIAAHTANLRRDDRATLFVRDPATAEDPQVTWRVGLTGHMVPLAPARRAGEALAGAALLDDEAHDALFARYRERVPGAKDYALTHDFDLWRMETVVAVRFIGGFGRIHWLAADKVLRPALAGGLDETAGGAVEHMNADHADALIDICRGLGGVTPEGARLVSLDRTGLLMRTEGPDGLCHVSFEREADAGNLRTTVVDLVRRARAAMA